MERKINLVGLSAQELRELAWEHMFLRISVDINNHGGIEGSLRSMNNILKQRGYTVSLRRKNLLKYRKAGRLVATTSIIAPANKVYGVGL